MEFTGRIFRLFLRAAELSRIELSRCGGASQLAGMATTRPFVRHAEGGRAIGDEVWWWRCYKVKGPLPINNSPYSSFPATMHAGLIA
jgi:hypothetical protein